MLSKTASTDTRNSLEAGPPVRKTSKKIGWIMIGFIGLVILYFAALFLFSRPPRDPEVTGPVTELPLRLNKIKIVGESVISIQPEPYFIDEDVVMILLHMPSQKMVFDDQTVITDAEVHVHLQNSTFITTLTGNPMSYVLILSYETQGVADYGIGPIEKRVIGYNFRASASPGGQWENVFFERTFLFSVDDEAYKKKGQKVLRESRKSRAVYGAKV